MLFLKKELMINNVTEKDLSKFDELPANTLTRTELKNALGEEAYVRLSPFQKKVLCDRFQWKYNAFSWAWNNITIGKLRRQLLNQNTILDLDMDKITEIKSK